MLFVPFGTQAAHRSAGLPHFALAHFLELLVQLLAIVGFAVRVDRTLSLVACGDSGKTPAADGDSNGGGDSSFPKMTWTAATSGAEGSNFDVGLEKFSELLQEKTNGAVKLDIYCSDQLTNGSTADSVQACMDGTIDVTFQADGIWGNFDTVFNIPNLPFLFDSYDDVDSKLINGEGGKYLMKAMEDKYNVKCLGIGENGFRYLTNSKHPVKTPDDLYDLKLRIGGAPILIATYESWGVDYTTAGWAEVYTGLQTKLYDGQENPIAVADASSIQEVQNYVTAWTANYGIMFMVINGDLYNSLSDELKAIVDECAKEACTYQVQYTRDECEAALQRWVDDYGIEVYEMTPENAELFRSKALKVYDKYTDYQQLIDMLK